MKNFHRTTALALASLSLALFAVGCSGSREVEVKGETRAAASTALSGKPIQLEVYDIPEDRAEEESRVATFKLDKAGAFQQKVELSGKRVRIVAIDDANGDGACTAGEAWGEAIADIADDDTVPPVTVELKAQPCRPITG